jgi:hypothetical protein
MDNDDAGLINQATDYAQSGDLLDNSQRSSV